MKQFFRVLTIWMFVLPLRVFSCGNEYETYTYTYTRANGTVKEYDYSVSGYYFEHGFDIEALEANRKRLEKKLAKHVTYQAQSDYALVLLKLGKNKQSLKILQDLVKKYPDEYTIIANLGTAYELNGQVDSALKYIQKAVRINPQSHEGSEWIHVKILKAKKKMQKYPQWLQEQSVLGLNIDIDKNYSEAEKEKFTKIKKELEWQLKERIAFVDAPDAIVASLLSDLADLIAVTEFLETSVSVYKLSLKYTPQNVEHVIEHHDRVKEIIFWSKVKSYLVTGIVVCFILAVIIYFVRKWWKRRKKRKAEKDSIPVFTSATLEK